MIYLWKIIATDVNYCYNRVCFSIADLKMLVGRRRVR